jgi:hypothetical protein
MTITINKKTFSGAANIHNGKLASILMAMLATQAKASAVTVATTALTDNGGGAAANGTIEAIPLATGTPLAGDTCPTKAEIETDFGQVKDALMEIAAQVVAVSAKVPAITPTNSIGGAAADGTIAAITVAITGATASRVAKAGFNTVASALRDTVAQLARQVNSLASATGYTLLIDSSGGNRKVTTNTVAAINTTTGTAAVDGTTSVVSAEATATLTALRNAVKELSTKLNSITAAGTPVPTVVIG